MQYKIALAGNPNTGKTTLFNALTGSNQFVGNWPGVTVEKKEGTLIGHPEILIQDLPGIYSLSPYTLEEVVSRTYLVKERPDAILNIVDGSNLERNLYLTTQLMELGIPVLMAVNMMDVTRANGDILYTEVLAKSIGCPVVEIPLGQAKASRPSSKKLRKWFRPRFQLSQSIPLPVRLNTPWPTSKKPRRAPFPNPRAAGTPSSSLNGMPMCSMP